MGMTAENEADAFVFEGFGKVRVVAEEDGGVRAARAGHGGADLLAFPPEVADATDPKALAAAAQGDAGVRQISDARLAEGETYEGGGMASVVVVAQDGKDALGGPEMAEFPEASVDPVFAIVDEVSGQNDEVGLEAIGLIHR